MMTSRILTFVALVVGLILTACDSNDDNKVTNPKPDACKQSCIAAIGADCSAEQGQPASACEADCLAAFAAYPQCESQILAMIQCSGLTVSSGWECHANGKSYPRTDVCVAEQMAAETCTSGH
jgi:hypothetical protein